MRQFEYRQLRALDEAKGPRTERSAPGGTKTTFLAGGTTLVDLMKLDVERPTHVVDVSRLGDPGLRTVSVTRERVRLGALVTMSEAADHPQLAAGFPMLVQSLNLAASAQIRNMASLGGNILQRTRCLYFRDTDYGCNKRAPGTGCPAMEGANRAHAVLGTSASCVATYHGDFAQALMALDARVETTGPFNGRLLAELHKSPGDTPHIETALRAGELITGFSFANLPWMRRSLYRKVRDRQSYEFALGAAAVALDLEAGIIRQCRIALGGVATIPWRARVAEKLLTGRRLDEAAATAAADAEFAPARTLAHNKVRLATGKATLVRALLEAGEIEI